MMSAAVVSLPFAALPMNRWLRAWFVMEVLFGVAAIASLTLDPTQTATQFAWTIAAVPTAAVLGGFYLAVAPIMLGACFTRDWAQVRVIVIPALLFTSSELLTTFMHWDRFHHTHPAFAIWLASYLLPPPIFLAGWLWHQRREPRRPPLEPLSPALRWSMALLGGLIVLEAVYAWVVPAWYIGSHALTFTPLTARAASGWMLAIGAMLISVAYEGDRARAWLVSPFWVLLLPVLTLQLGRYASGVDLLHPRLWGMALLLAVLMMAGLYLARSPHALWARWWRPLR